MRRGRTLVALVAVLIWGGFETAEARGGRGPGRAPTRRGVNRKAAQARERSDQRLDRVAWARLEYARRERQEMWDAEALERWNRTLEQVLGGSTE